MPFTTDFAGDLLELFLNNAAVPYVGDAAGLQPSASDGVFYLSLHIAAPGVGVTDQTTNETAYPGYARLAVSRDGTKWTRNGAVFTPTDLLVFAKSTSGSGSITHVGFGSDETGAGHLFCYGAITPSIPIKANVTPVINTSSEITLA